ncbi:MAG: EscU/YscU/HrcU family type III secretion system export apparatus switch protein [Campylobacterales bacterium]|nr:EscU/YscU/HrcU family type III secretion system export apparatus switch protein [Campylobacterales bacterium]
MKKAVALRYDTQKEDAPRVVATGKGETAENIIKLAQLHNIPIKKDEDLVELLSKVEIDHKIPEKLYAAVVEVFKFLYTVTRSDSKNNPKDTPH